MHMPHGDLSPSQILVVLERLEMSWIWSLLVYIESSASSNFWEMRLACRHGCRAKDPSVAELRKRWPQYSRENDGRLFGKRIGPLGPDDPWIDYPMFSSLSTTLRTWRWWRSNFVDLPSHFDWSVVREHPLDPKRQTNVCSSKVGVKQIQEGVRNRTSESSSFLVLHLHIPDQLNDNTHASLQRNHLPEIGFHLLERGNGCTDDGFKRYDQVDILNCPHQSNPCVSIVFTLCTCECGWVFKERFIRVPSTRTDLFALIHSICGLSLV